MNPEMNESILTLPAHIARPLHELYRSNLYFKRLHLISDVLLGFFRLYGHALISIIEEEEISTELLDQSTETLKTKDSHGLWSTTIANMLQESEASGKLSVPDGLISVFGISVPSRNIKPVKRLTVKNTIIDGKGQKQIVEVTNTPIELLINFRNKYVGHGTVYSEKESEKLFQIYEPILKSFIDSLNVIKDFTFSDASSNSSIHGYDKGCSGNVIVYYNNINYNFEVHAHLYVEKYENSIIEKSSVIEKDEEDIQIIETYPYFIAHAYKRALEEEDGFKRLHLLKEVFLNYLKYFGLLTASEYFNSSLKIGEINRAFKNFLYRPQFGHWNAFMRSAIQALKDNNHSWFIKELPDYYEKVETRPYAENGETKIGKLIDFRNH